MSNISPFGGKNPPWARGVTNSSGTMVNQNSSLQQQLLTQNALGAMGASGMVQYQQPQVFQTQMSMQQQNISLGIAQLGNPSMTVPTGMGSQMSTGQMFSQVGAVTYPAPRSLNTNAFQNSTINNDAPMQGGGNSTKQRVFTGTVTKVHDNFGFVDDDVFFQTSACVKGSNPSVGDRVLVEASFNANMPFKWNATRIQVLPLSSTSAPRHASNHNSKPFATSNSYNAVPPPSENTSSNYGPSPRANQRQKSSVGGRGRSRERSRDDEENERKKRRDDRGRDRDEKEKKLSPVSRRRSRSPKTRRRPLIVPRYMVHIPKIALDLPEADYLEIRRRYANLYVPSDFFNSQFRWVDAFPPNAPFTLNKPCSFHIMNKEVDPIVPNPSVLEPADADYLFSAKVMLMSMPTMQEVYQKCCSMAEDREKKDRDSEERDFIHPTRLVNFLVGLRGKNETMALGGPWSPSLDGPDPERNPSVLINTAIRSCRALTGIDLSTCTQWYRFVELYYRRGESTHKGKVIPARVETVVLFLPDVWSCVPTRLEWDSLQHSYKQQLEQKLWPEQDADGVYTADEKDEEDPSTEEKITPSHYSELDPKTMSVTDLRSELRARNLSPKGLKSQLIARLSRRLKAEAEKFEEDVDGEALETETGTSTDQEEKAEKKEKTEEENKLIDEKEKLVLEKRYTLPEGQHILVHPSKVAKSGKFDCTVMSLSLLLDYRPEDTKEHSFEVSLFAELFNEMLMRDFGFNIYKSLSIQPDKPKEDKDDRKKKEEPKKKEDEKKRDKIDEKKKDDKDKEKKDEKKIKKEEDEDDDDEDEEDDKKDRKRAVGEKDRRKKDRQKLYTKDPQLLLSFVYFDQTHCGYIFEKDIEDLLFTLGLSLSRAQVRKLVSKVITRDSLDYRKLTDKPKEEKDDGANPENLMDKDAEHLAMGNKGLLPIFTDQKSETSRKKLALDTSETLTDEQRADGFVMYQGGLLHVEKLMTHLKRIENACADTETLLVELKVENKKLIEKNTKASSTIKELTSDLKEYKEKLQSTNSTLEKVTTSSKLFHNTLKDIKKQIEPIISNKLYLDNDKSNHESRWSDPEGKGLHVFKEEPVDAQVVKECDNTEMEIEPLVLFKNMTVE